MHTSNTSSNTGRGVTRFVKIENVSRPVSMTSLELVDFINEQREKGEPVLDHGDFMKKVPRVLKKDAGKFSDIYLDSMNRKQKSYRFPKRESCLMAMSYSYELQAAVFDYMTELESLQLVTLPDFSNPAASARAWAEQFELQQAAQQALALAAPKVAFVDRYVESAGLLGFRQVAKILKANERSFRKMLIESGVMYYLNGELTPKQAHIDAGRFEVKTGTSERTSHTFAQSRFTSKGVEWIAGKWASYSMQGVA